MDASWDTAVIDDALADVDAGIDALTQLPRHQRGLSPNLAHWRGNAPTLDRSGSQAAPVRLRPSDVFDEFDGG